MEEIIHSVRVHPHCLPPFSGFRPPPSLNAVLRTATIDCPLDKAPDFLYRKLFRSRHHLERTHMGFGGLA